jgi:hypothetical protein
MADLKVKVGVDKSGFTTGLASMENSVKGFGNKVGGILAGAFAFDKIIQGFSNAIDKGDQLQDLANRFGVAASSLQEIGNAASTSGAGLEDVASAMNKLAKNAGAAIGGNEQMAEAFSKIGLSVEQLNGMSPQDLFLALSKAVASGTLGMQDFTIAQELAGKGAAALMETLRMGPEVISANGQAMGVWTDETILKLSEASDAIKTFQNTMTIAFGGVAQIAMPLIKAFQDIVELATMIGAAGASALKGDFAGAAQITKEASMIKSRRDAEEAKAARQKAGRSIRDVDGQTSEAGSGVKNKTAEIEKNRLKSAEDKLADAVRDRESLSMDDAQKLGRAQAELLEMKIKESEIADKTLEKLQAQEEIERKKIEVLQLQKQIKNDLADAEADAIKAAGSGDLRESDQAQLRLDRLRDVNKARGNASDFDPREALMQRFGLGNQLRDIPSSTEAQRTQPVRLENPPNLQGVLDKLDLLIKNAGVFS